MKWAIRGSHSSLILLFVVIAGLIAITVTPFTQKPAHAAFTGTVEGDNINCTLRYAAVAPTQGIRQPGGGSGSVDTDDEQSDWEALLGFNFTSSDGDLPALEVVCQGVVETYLFYNPWCASGPGSSQPPGTISQFGSRGDCPSGWGITAIPSGETAVFTGGFTIEDSDGLDTTSVQTNGFENDSTLHGSLRVEVDPSNPREGTVTYFDNSNNLLTTTGDEDIQTVPFSTDSSIDVTTNADVVARIFRDSDGPISGDGGFINITRIRYNGEIYEDQDWGCEDSNCGPDADHEYYLVEASGARANLVNAAEGCRPYLDLDRALHLDSNSDWAGDITLDINEITSGNVAIEYFDFDESCNPGADDIDVRGSIDTEFANIFFQYSAIDNTVRPYYVTGDDNESRYIGDYTQAPDAAANDFRYYIDTSNPSQSAYVEFSSDPSSLPVGEPAGVSFNMRSTEGSQGTTTALRAMIRTTNDITVSTPLDDDSGVAEPTCESSNPALGWFLCPVANFMLETLESVLRDGVVASILSFDALEDGTSQRQSLENVWIGFRTLANAGFVIAFFVFVYSAVSGGVLSAYDVKKLAPKLMVGAIAVQLSLFICIQLVRIFNALGDGIATLMLSPIPGGGGVDGVFPNEAFLNTSAFTSALGGLVSTLVLLFIIVGVIFSIVGILIMIVVFLLRNMALIVLTVISPLAFVCWILPNTESLFKKWWGFYIQLLALFPIAIAFLSSGRLISYVWSNGSDNWANVWIGMIALFLPYVIAPKMFQFAGSAIGGIVNGVNNGKQTLQQRGGKLGGMAKDSRVGRRVRAGQTMSGNSKLAKAINKAGQATTNPGAVVGMKGGRQRRQARASDKFDETLREDERAANTLLNKEIAGMDQGTRKDHLRDIATGRGTDEAKMAAMKRMIVDNDFDGLEQAMIGMSQSSSGRAAVARFQNENAGDLSTKARHLLTADAQNLADGHNAAGAKNLAKADGNQLAAQHGTSVRAAVGQLQAANDHASQQRMVETFDGLDDQAKARMSKESKDAIEWARSNVLVANPGATHILPTDPTAHSNAVTDATTQYAASNRSGAGGLGLDQTP